MKYSIYPFKRYDKFRLYLVFSNENGKEVRRSTGIYYGLKATKKQKKEAHQQAEEKAREILMEYFKGEPEEPDEPNTEILEDYLEAYYYPHVKAECASSTLVSYRNAIDHFLRICGNRKLDEYNRFDFEKYKIYRLNKEDIAKTTINIELRSIKAAFNWAYKYELLDRNPYRGQDYLFDTKSNRRAFTTDEIQTLFKQTAGKMIGLVFRLTYFTGMRIGEVSALKWKMVDLDDSSIHLPAIITKTKKERAFPIGDKAFNLLKIYQNLLKKHRREYPEYYQDRPESECYVLQKERGEGRYKRRSIQDMFRKEMNAAGLPKELKFHCLRHSFATHTRAKGGDLGAVSKILGHTTTQVTEKFYDHTTALNFRETVNLL